MPPITFSRIVDDVRRLDVESKHELLALLRKWLIEERREEIARNAELAASAHAQGQARSGNIDDLMADLYGED